MSAIYWHLVIQHLWPSQQVSRQFIDSHFLTICIVICMASHSTSSICKWYNFGKYNIFYTSDEAMLFVMAKVCLWLKIFLFYKTCENFFLLTNNLLKPLAMFCDKYFIWKTKENITTGNQVRNFIVLSISVDSSPCGTLIWCISCLG